MLHEVFTLIRSDVCTKCLQPEHIAPYLLVKLNSDLSAAGWGFDFNHLWQQQAALQDLM